MLNTKENIKMNNENNSIDFLTLILKKQNEKAFNRSLNYAIESLMQEYNIANAFRKHEIKAQLTKLWKLNYNNK